ncbi:putative glutamate-rich WD repeat-containing protein 1 isoform X1, partial [Apostichopus japonicus]
TLASGDCKKNIHIWKMEEGGTWRVDQRPYVAHSDSIEDIQWSPNEKTVFASCSVDKSIRVWDIRAAPSKACMLTVENTHESDVNVISWNKTEPFIISAKISTSCKVQTTHSTITSVEWHPIDSTVFACSGADDQITLWDLALERDPMLKPRTSKWMYLPSCCLYIRAKLISRSVTGILRSLGCDCYIAHELVFRKKRKKSRISWPDGIGAELLRTYVVLEWCRSFAITSLRGHTRALFLTSSGITDYKLKLAGKDSISYLKNPYESIMEICWDCITGLICQP